MMRRKAEFLLALVLMLVGGMVYILFRPRTILLFIVLDTMGLGGMIDQWRMSVNPCALPDFVVYSLPNGLWVTSYVLVIDVAFRDSPVATRLRWASVIPVLGVVSELLQVVGVVPGTFDWADLLCYAVPYLVYLIIIKTKRYETGLSD